MSKKIGQALIEKDLITEKQLDTALRTQLIHGGQLGTSLIELGFVDENTLGRTLAEIQELPYARKEMFDAIPPEILETVPRSIVQKRRVIPIGIHFRSLYLAVVSPRNLSNLSSATGYKILPHLAPEIRVVQAMEQYYGIPRPRRYVQLAYDLAQRAKSQPHSPRIPDPLPQVHSRPPKVHVAGEPETVPEVLEDLSRRMSAVASRSELGELILDYSLQQMDRAILFDVSGENAVVANWKGIDLDDGQMSRVSLPITPDSIFSLLAEDPFYEGPAPQDVACQKFYETLGMEVPKELLILPIYGDDGLEAVIYGDSGADGRIERAAAYPMLVERIALAMKLLGLKEQLCRHADPSPY